MYTSKNNYTSKYTSIIKVSSSAVLLRLLVSKLLAFGLSFGHQILLKQRGGRHKGTKCYWTAPKHGEFGHPEFYQRPCVPDDKLGSDASHQQSESK